MTTAATALPEEPVQIPVRRSAFTLLTVIFTVTSVLLYLIGIRLAERGRWLPELPADLPGWTATVKPLTTAAIQQLGNPRTRGFSYTNVFGDTVAVHAIATSSFQSYLDPRTTMVRYRYGITGVKEMPLFGRDGTARGLVFRSAESESRVMMYYWVQYRNGTTNPGEAFNGGTEFLPSLRLGGNAVLAGMQNCVIRVFADIPPGDTEGIQTRRNIEEIARAVHEALKADKSTGGVL